MFLFNGLTAPDLSRAVGPQLAWGSRGLRTITSRAMESRPVGDGSDSTDEWHLPPRIAQGFENARCQWRRACKWLPHDDSLIPCPSGRIQSESFPGTSCQATIIQSLRDKFEFALRSRTHYGVAFPVKQWSKTPLLPYSLTPSLPHSLTPSLPHSLTPSLPVAGFEDDDEDENENEA
jgi:hypothetical protein